MTCQSLQELYSTLEPLSQNSGLFLQEGRRIVKDFYSAYPSLENIEFKGPLFHRYRRTKLFGETGFVIRLMEWSPRYALPPHEHHGRPCIELLLEGKMTVTDMKAEPEADLHKLLVIETHELSPGAIASIDPQVTDIHSVYCEKRCTSLHFYPKDESEGHVYKQQKSGLFSRRKVLLPDD